jgi:hypothetical protein
VSGVSFGALFMKVLFVERLSAVCVTGALMGSSFRYVIPTGEDGGAAAGKKRVEHLGSKSKVNCYRMTCGVRRVMR